MAKARLIVDVEYDIIDEDGDLFDPNYLIERANDELDADFTLVSCIPVPDPADAVAAENWHREECSEDECEASDEARAKYPCPVVQEEAEEEREETDSTARELGISLSSFG